MALFSSVTVATVTGALVGGAFLTLAQHLKAILAARLDLRDLRLTALSAALNLTGLAMLPVAGMLTDGFGGRALLASGSLLAAVAIAILAITRNFGGAILGALLLGNSCACLTVASCTLIPAAFPGTPTLAAVNLGFVFLAAGALLTPPLVEKLRQWLDDRRGLGALALACLLPALGAALTDVKGFPGPDPNAASQALAQRPDFWLIALALFLYLPVEQFLSTWAPRYLGEAGHTERGAAWLVAGFWLAFLGGRLLALLVWDQNWALPKRGLWVIFGLTVIAAIFVGNLSGASSRRKAIPAAALLGIGMLLGPVFPTLVGVLFERLPLGTWGVAFGGATAVGWLGGQLVEPLLGAYAQRTSVRHALWVLIVGLLLLSLVVFVLGVSRIQ